MIQRTKKSTRPTSDDGAFFVFILNKIVEPTPIYTDSVQVISIFNQNAR